MRPVEEVVGKGMRSPVHEIQAEIDERQAILDGLPAISSQSEDSESIELSIDNQRVKLEKEIFKLNWWIAFDELEKKYFNKHEFIHSKDNEQAGLQIRDVLSTWASSYRKGYASGRNFERRQQQSIGGKKKDKKIYDEFRKYCSTKAREIWEHDDTVKIGKVANQIHDQIEKMPYCPTTATIKKWLKNDPDLIIPKAATIGGRPKKQ